MSILESDTPHFKSLYNNLKEEYEQSKKDNEEICKEYESTIQLLSDSMESFKNENKDLKLKLSKIENEQKVFKREKDNLIKKNKDKIIDIQCLNEQNDKLKEVIKKLKEEKTLFDTKIVTLENDIDHYQNKIREYEDFIDELKTQLEDALEENITLQTEFETYKLTTGDQLIRKDEELKDIKNDITTKEKIIQKLSKKSSEFNIQKMQELFNDKNLMRSRRRYTLGEKYKYPMNKNIKNNLEYIEENENENNNKENNNNDKTPNKDFNTIINNSNDYKKTLITCKTSLKKIGLNGYNSNNTESKMERNITKNLNFNHEFEINNKNKKNENNENNENKMNGLNSIIKKQFGELVICEENKIYINPLINNLLNKEQIKEFTISLQNMLIRYQQRRNYLYNQKKAIKDKLKKLSFRIK